MILCVYQGSATVSVHVNVSTHRCQVQVIKHATTCLPDRRAAILLLAFIYKWVTRGDVVDYGPERTVEAIYLSDLPTFMVSS